MTAISAPATLPLSRPRGRPRTEDLAALEGRIISASSELFFRQGYGATTMMDVARAARVSKTTLYARFSSKADLFRAIVAAQVESWMATVPFTPIEQCETPEQTLLAYGDMALHIGTSAAYVQMSRLMYNESWHFPELREAADSRFNMGMDELTRRFQVFAERGHVGCKDPLAMLELFQLTLMGWCSETILADRAIIAEQRDAWLGRVVATFLHSLSE